MSDKPQIEFATPAYSYDELDRLAAVSAPGLSIGYAYDAAGGYLNRVSDPMGITYMENQYTPDGKVASQKNGNEDQGEWDYDLENMKATFTDNEGNEVVAAGETPSDGDLLGMAYLVEGIIGALQS